MRFSSFSRIERSVELLRKPVLATEPDAVRKLKIFYQTCVSAGRALLGERRQE